MNLWDILILSAIAVLLIFAFRRTLRGDHGGCCGNCVSCGCPCSKKKEHT